MSQKKDKRIALIPLAILH